MESEVKDMRWEAGPTRSTREAAGEPLQRALVVVGREAPTWEGGLALLGGRASLAKQAVGQAAITSESGWVV